MPKLPESVRFGDFVLAVQAYENRGSWDPEGREFAGVSGTAWLLLHCVETPLAPVDLVALSDHSAIVQDLEVVERVVNRQTEISLADAKRFHPDAAIGETLRLETALDPQDLQAVVSSGIALADRAARPPARGSILVAFDGVTIRPTRDPNVGLVVDGSAAYPARPRVPERLHVHVAGFVLELNAVQLTAGGATATVSVQLPDGLTDRATCGPVTLDVGQVPLTPDCALSVEAADAAFGPWIVGDTGLTVTGTGFTLDLTTSGGSALQPAAWQGLVLHSGHATGADLVPEPANTGYLRGSYSFTDAAVTAAGMTAHLALDGTHAYGTLAPLGYLITLQSASLELAASTVAGGELGPGMVDLPVRAVCAGTPGSPVSVGFTTLHVAGDLDVAGTVDCARGLPLTWGELTHAGAEQLVWDIQAAQGFLYLPADPSASFTPAALTGFLDVSLSAQPDVSMTTLEANGMAGLALRELSGLRVHSADRPGGTANPLGIQQLSGWLRVGHAGVDGALQTIQRLDDEELGEPARPGYVGRTPFAVDLFGQDKVNLVAQYAASAVYDSAMNGTFHFAGACDIDLSVAGQQLTSTAQLVGGDVALPPGGVTLDYWQLQLTPAGDAARAGVLSTRTGRVIFTAAGISEPRHFARPFRLTWGELLADGDLGELLFDYNNDGQRFDLIPFVPQHVALSPYVPGSTDGYLAVCGNVHFNFFGPRFVNLRDARYHDKGAPYGGRYVTSPKAGEVGCPATDLHLAKDWDDKNGEDLAVFDFPDAVMDYFVDRQDGFIGGVPKDGTRGACTLPVLGAEPLDAVVELHHNAIDVRLRSEAAHDLDLGLYARLGSISDIYGCIRIEGPLLSRISLYSLLEQSVTTGTGIIEPKAGYAVEVNLTTTPNSLDFTASGDIILQVAGAAVDLSASVHLLKDFSRDTVEGEVVGRVDCGTVLGGLEGDGQLTWFIGPRRPGKERQRAGTVGGDRVAEPPEAVADVHYVQGRLKVLLCSWVANGALEGGLFLGQGVPKDRAWVLHTDSPRFGISDEMLSDHLTGVFGYGRIAFGFNWYIFGGGIELYAGMGAFAALAPGQIGKGEPWSDLPDSLPYVIGACGIYVHGEILGGLVGASAWAELELRGPVPYFEGSFGLEGCVLWVICASIRVTAGFNSGGFYIN